MRIRSVVSVAALAAVLTVAACSGGTPSPTGSRSGSLAGQSVEVAGTWSGTEQESFQLVLDEFAKKTGASVKYTSGGDDLAALINSRLAGGSPPDVALIPQPGVVNEFARKGAIKELTGPAAEAIAANYSTAWQDLGKVDGKLYGVYFKVANKSVVWYRDDKFAEGGGEAPADLGGVRKVSKALSDSGIPPMAVRR